MNKNHQELINKNVNYIRKVANDLTRSFCYQNKSLNQYYSLRDELCSYAFEVMCDKIEDYDENKGAFYNYAYNVLTPNLKNYYYRHILKDKIENREYSEMLSDNDELNELYCDNSEENIRESIAKDIKNECLVQSIQSLDDETEREFIRLIYFDRKTISEASKIVGLKGTSTTNYYHHNRILEKLKKRLHHFENILNNLELLEEEEQIVLKSYFFQNMSLDEISERENIDNVEDVYDSGLKHLHLLKKIHELPKKQRDILRDYYFEKLTLDFISFKYGIKNIDEELSNAHILLKDRMGE